MTTCEDQVNASATESQEVTEGITAKMGEFDALRSSAHSNDAALEFFREIDEGLKGYNENLNLLSNGAQFYKQMQ